MTRFSTLNCKIKGLLESYNQRERFAGLIKGQIENGEDPKEKHIRKLKNEISEMRKVAIVIRFYSELVAAVIQDVVIPGFGDATRTSHVNILDENVERMVREQEARNKSYLEASEQKCRLLSQEAVRLMGGEIARTMRLEISNPNAE